MQSDRVGQRLKDWRAVVAGGAGYRLRHLQALSLKVLVAVLDIDVGCMRSLTAAGMYGRNHFAWRWISPRRNSWKAAARQ